MDANQRSVKSNPAALLPIGVFLVLYLGCGLLFEYGLKIEQGFYQTPAIVIFLTPWRSPASRTGSWTSTQDEGDGRRCGPTRTS